MCGIAGTMDARLAGADGTAANATFHAEASTAIRTALDVMATRGPDDQGIWSGPGIVLGHRRLAIIDVQGGRQPLTDRETGVVLTFNGEIFNYRDLQRELVALGHGFATASDTEVLLRAYLQWGEDCLARLSGMFAFALYDPRRRALFLARDRIGVKPLFYAVQGARLRFASSCAALRRFPGVGRALDLAAVSHYLTTIRATLGRRTLYRDIRSLLPGECMTLTAGAREPTIRRYWDFPIVSPADKPRPDFDEAADRVRALLEHAVREQLISDVPLGGFLSGGIDSSVLAALAAKETGGAFTAYSVGYARAGYNEWPFTRATAAMHKTPCREVELNEADFPELWLRLIQAKGLPLSTPNEVPIFSLSQALRREFTVALSGEGADEIFGGYVTPYFSAFDYDRARRAAPAPDDPPTATDRALRRLYRRPYFLCRPDHYFLVNTWMPFDAKRRLLSADAWRELDGDAAVFGFYEEWFDRLRDCTTFDAYMQVHARVNLEGLLARVDSSAMAASVEARVPFTDHRLAEYLFTLPDDYKMAFRNDAARASAADRNVAEIDRGNLIESKRLLRHAFRRDVPPAVMARPKVSFPVPFREWFSESLRDMARSAFERSSLPGTLFDRATLNSLLATADRPPSAMALWPLTNLCLWEADFMPDCRRADW
jgi:asparagine synthase (glutamine-hydrolysing)